MPDTSDAMTLTYGLRELIWGIESEVAVITSLSQRIDDHVVQLNEMRAEAARRLLELDDLVASARDSDLATFLEQAVIAPLPEVPEHFPERIYGA